VLMFPEGTRSPDGAVHDFKSGAGYLALHGGCDVLPIRIIGTHRVLGKGSLIPRRAPVEVRIGAVITNAQLRELAADTEGAGAYRKLADYMRDAVLGVTDRATRRLAASAQLSIMTPPRKSASRPRIAHRRARG
ncbi:MAG: lysophospholipid acyltransferase family protein, partial [Candidatus Binataceae bacterium]